MPPESCDNRAALLSRRSFLKGLGAAAAAMLPACRRAEEFVVPYRETPEWTIPGEASAYATCLPRAGGSLPLLAVCHDGAPTLLQANPRYTFSAGLDARAQASLWNLYDPGRCRRVCFHGRDAEEGELQGAFAAWAQQIGDGGRVGFLWGDNPSPVRDALAAEIARRNPHARFYASNAHASDGEAQALGALLEPGTRSRIAFENARFVLSLGRDFLGTDPAGSASAFAKAYTPRQKGASTELAAPDLHLVVVEESSSLTGGMARQTLPCPQGMENFLDELIDALRPLAEREAPSFFATRSQASRKVSSAVAELACNLWHHRGEALLLLGSAYPERMHAAVLALNVLLEANGGPLQFVQGEADARLSLDALAADLAEGRLETLFLFSPGDPAAEHAALADALRTGAAETIRLCLYEDQTASLSTWSLPGTHFLEEWGLDRTIEGQLCLRQPVVQPLYGGIAELEILSGLLSAKGRLLTANDAPQGLSPAYHRVVSCFHQWMRPTGGSLSSERERLWANAIETGLAGNGYPLLHRLPKATVPRLEPAALPAGHCPISCRPDELFQTQADLHNAWLAETWHPLTNLAGSLAARASLPGLRHGEVRLLHLRREGLPSLHLPVIGDDAEASLAAGSHITLPLIAAEVLNTFPWCSVASVSFESIELAPIADTPPQRPIAVFGSEGIPGISSQRGVQKREQLPPPAGKSPEQWGMAIDLNLCTGCNACLVACRAENNIPTVGRDELARGRDMQWLRIDRYLVKQHNELYRMNVPVACQQCEAAPCESVCPVNATVHTSDGLSAMVYPRCWGTRYCAANCPYEARHFNFFDYAKASMRTAHTAANPNVTVRSRGVMEKCTYCVQRINDARRRHRSQLMQGSDLPSMELELRGDDLILPPGSVQTACQAACPMHAISFGNIASSGGRAPSDALQAHESPRAFSLLPHLGTRPRTVYLKRWDEECSGEA